MSDSAEDLPGLRGTPAQGKLVIACLGGLSDFVLLEPLVATLQAHRPEASLILLGTEPCRALVDLFAKPAAWLGTTLHQQSSPGDESQRELARLRAAPELQGIETFLTADTRGSWAQESLLRELPAVRRLALNLREASRISVPVEVLSQEPGETRWSSVQGLASKVTGQNTEKRPPSLHFPPALLDETRELLLQLGLQEGHYATCSTSGFGAREEENWAEENFIAVARAVAREKGIPSLLISQEGQPPRESVLREAIEAEQIKVWTAKPGQEALLTGLLELSAFYLGGSEGLTPLAAACGRPVAVVQGGGYWPASRPAAAASAEFVLPLPCFACAWNCPFGDKPCLKGISPELVLAGIRELLGSSTGARLFCPSAEDTAKLDFPGRALHLHKRLLQQASETAQKLETGQHALAAKEAELSTLRAVCAERLELIGHLDTETKRARSELTRFASDVQSARKEQAELQRRLREAEERGSKAPQEPVSTGAQAEITRLRGELEQLRSEKRVLEATVKDREASIQNLSRGLGTLEQNKLHARQLRERDLRILVLEQECREKAELLSQLGARQLRQASLPHRLLVGTKIFWRTKLAGPTARWLQKRLLDGYWMQLGTLRQYSPVRPTWDPAPRRLDRLPTRSPQLGVVTLSHDTATHLEATLHSVIEQQYSRLRYVVQDEDSHDGSREIIRRSAPHLHAWESVRTAGRADALLKGFDKLSGSLLPEDVMGANLAGDLLAPGCLRYIAAYFAEHPEVDVVYGHRLILDKESREIGRWVYPSHRSGCFQWEDLVPLETLFWRKRAWDRAGGMDPSLHFHAAWDLFLRFERHGAKIVRLPCYLGAHRVFGNQREHHFEEGAGREEALVLLQRLHAGKYDKTEADLALRQLRQRAALQSRLLDLGL